MFLLTDTGGTNTRIAVGDGSGILRDSVQSYRNADFDSFDDVVQTYVTDHGHRSFAACAFAFAGPVKGRAPRLTNLHWQIDADHLQQTLAAPVRLLNDLEAMGRALPALAPGDLLPLSSGHGVDNGQLLAVGVGTGMNACAVKPQPDAGPAVWACEYGHAPLPAPLHKAIEDTGLRLREATVTEHLFSGRGLAMCREAGITDLTYAGWLGQLCATLSVQFLPLGGLYLAGGVARAVLTPEGIAPFQHSLRAALPHMASEPPVFLITADDAALQGCLSVLTH